MSTLQSLKDSGLKATLPRRKILELFESSKVRHLSAEDVYKALITEGSGAMPPFADAISSEDKDNVIAFLKTL